MTLKKFITAVTGSVIIQCDIYIVTVSTPEIKLSLIVHVLHMHAGQLQLIKTWISLLG
jgi:hypothetical protein